MRYTSPSTRATIFNFWTPTMAELSLQGRMILSVTNSSFPHTKQHPTNDIGARNTFRALDLLVFPGLLRKRVGVGAVGKDAGVVAVDDVIDVVLVEQLLHELLGDGVGRIWDHLVHPLDGVHHYHPLLQGRHGGPLVHDDLRVADDADHELVPQGAGLPEGVAVAVVHHVEAPVHVDPHRPLLPPPPAAEPGPDPERGAVEVEPEQRGPDDDAADEERREELGLALRLRRRGGVRTCHCSAEVAKRGGGNESSGGGGGGGGGESGAVASGAEAALAGVEV